MERKVALWRLARPRRKRPPDFSDSFRRGVLRSSAHERGSGPFSKLPRPSRGTVSALERRYGLRLTQHDGARGPAPRRPNPPVPGPPPR
jgi:hypothetical protein